MVGDLKAIVVGASEEQSAHVRQCLSDWECVSAPLNDEDTAASSAPPAAKLIVVYARTKGASTLAICRRLRDAPKTSAAPILLAVNRYELLKSP